MTQSESLRVGRISTRGFLLRIYGDCYNKKRKEMSDISKSDFLQKKASI